MKKVKEVEKAPPQQPSPLEINPPTVVKEETLVDENIPPSEIKSATSTLIKEETPTKENISSSYLTDFPEINTGITKEKVAKAAKNLADFFSGEVIELRDELIFEEIEFSQTSLDQDLEDDYDDF